MLSDLTGKGTMERRVDVLVIGAEHGRFRCFGGTSTRWGGALIPFQSADLDPEDWPVSLYDLTPYVAELEALFGLEEGPYTDEGFPFELGKDFVNRLGKWPPFRKRNVASLLGAKARSLSNLDLWLNATVIRIETGSADAPVRVVARSAKGDTITVVSDRLIIAAGAIETTRLALLIDRQNGEVISSVSPALGRNFSDHISLPVAEITPTRPAELNRIVGFRFGSAGGMCNIRFEITETTALRGRLAPSFTHIGFEVDKPGGFDALREVFCYFQMRRLPPVRVGINLLRNMPWLMRAVWWRFVHKRLLFPSGSRLVANVVIEQKPLADHRITLSPDRTDPFGVPLAAIHWQVDADDLDQIRQTADAFETTWNEPILPGSGRGDGTRPTRGRRTRIRREFFTRPG